MQVSFDQYVRNVRMFYNQLIKGHAKQDELAPKFKQMIEAQTKKWRKVLAVRKENRTGQTASLLNKLKQQKGIKGKPQIAVQVLYASSDIRNLIVFGYCFLLMEHKNPAALQFLTERMKEPLQNREVFSEPMLRKVRNLWDKMEHVVAGKRRILRFQKQLQDCFKDMHQLILQLLFAIITSGKQVGQTSTEQFLTELTKLLGIKVEYFNISQKDDLGFTTYGQTFDLVMRFGHFSKEKIFGYVSKLPQKQEVQVNKQATMNSFAQISEVLSSMYSDSSKQYKELASGSSKPGKLRRSGSLAYGSGVQSKFTSGRSKLMRRSSATGFGLI